RCVPDPSWTSCQPSAPEQPVTWHCGHAPCRASGSCLTASLRLWCVPSREARTPWSESSRDRRHPDLPRLSPFHFAVPLDSRPHAGQTTLGAERFLQLSRLASEHRSSCASLGSRECLSGSSCFR